VTPSTIQRAGDLIYVIGETDVAFGGSELQNLLTGSYEGQAPKLDLNVEKERQQNLLQGIQAGLVTSAQDISEGGLAVGLAESMFNDNNLGIEAKLTGDVTTLLFSETQSRFIVTVHPDEKMAFEAQMSRAIQIGTVTEKHQLTIHVNDELVIDEDAYALNTLWKEAIPSLLKLHK